jgi:GNAT superfamily N-acetyltransferase
VRSPGARPIRAAAAPPGNPADAEGGIRLERLAPASPLVDTLARWDFDQWGHLDPVRPLDAAIAAFRALCGPGGVPSVFVALHGEIPVGMASLIADDMPDRPALMPWLASVYVVPGWRGLGIASRLVRRVEEEARSHGIGRLYLFTPDREALYRRLGWHELERRHYRGEAVTLMRRILQAGEA